MRYVFGDAAGVPEARAGNGCDGACSRVERPVSLLAPRDSDVLWDRRRGGLGRRSNQPIGRQAIARGHRHMGDACAGPILGLGPPGHGAPGCRTPPASGGPHRISEQGKALTDIEY